MGAAFKLKFMNKDFRVLDNLNIFDSQIYVFFAVKFNSKGTYIKIP